MGAAPRVGTLRRLTTRSHAGHMPQPQGPAPDLHEQDGSATGRLHHTVHLSRREPPDTLTPHRQKWRWGSLRLEDLSSALCSHSSSTPDTPHSGAVGPTPQIALGDERRLNATEGDTSSGSQVTENPGASEG